MFTKILWIIIFTKKDAKGDKDQKKLLMVTELVSSRVESEPSWPI